MILQAFGTIRNIAGFRLAGMTKGKLLYEALVDMRIHANYLGVNQITSWRRQTPADYQFSNLSSRPRRILRACIRRFSGRVVAGE